MAKPGGTGATVIDKGAASEMQLNVLKRYDADIEEVFIDAKGAVRTT